MLVSSYKNMVIYPYKAMLIQFFKFITHNALLFYVNS
jgi:hypothetical protein